MYRWAEGGSQEIALKLLNEKNINTKCIEMIDVFVQPPYLTFNEL